MSFDPSPLEQVMLEDINRMRTDPAGELDVLFTQTRPLLARDPDIQGAINFFNVNGATLLSQWSELEPAPPVAWNESLYDAALGHNRVMIEQDKQDHVLEEEPSIEVRVRDAGYDWTAVVENVYAFGKTAIQAHAGFIIDWGDTPSGIQDPAGHRRNMMNPYVQEVGASIVYENDPTTDVGPLVITQDFGRRGNYIPQVLGVVYEDKNDNRRYDAGEGLRGVKIEAVGGPETWHTTTMSAGGYQFPVPRGTFTIVASGGPLSGPLVVPDVVMDGENVKVDINTRTALRPPTALNDSVNTDEDVPVTINVSANDSDGDGTLDLSSVRITSTPSQGTVELIANRGEVRYTPRPDFSGTDRFTYRILNDRGAPSNEATVIVMVGAVNDPPVARDDHFVIDEDTRLSATVLVNDSDVDGTIDPSTLQIVRPPRHGDVVRDAVRGTFEYTPHPEFAGDDSFTYSVQDNDGANSRVATSTITVRSVNDAPLAVSDDAVTWQETSITLDVIANDLDVDGRVQPSTAGITRFPDHGQVQVDRATGRMTYTPALGFFGADSFAYAVLDNASALSNQAVVNIIVTEAGFPWSNPILSSDVNNDGQVAPQDALVVVTDLMENHARRLPVPTEPSRGGPPFFDTSRDGLISPVDALLVIYDVTSPRSANRRAVSAPPSAETDRHQAPLDAAVMAIPDPDTAGGPWSTMPIPTSSAGYPVPYGSPDNTSAGPGDELGRPIENPSPREGIRQRTMSNRAAPEWLDPLMERSLWPSEDGVCHRVTLEEDLLHDMAQDVAGALSPLRDTVRPTS